jgi:hypothetical protein
MRRKALLIVTAIGEVGTGLFLVLLPQIVLALLLGVTSAAIETIFISRVAGAALVSIGVASWLSREDRHSNSQYGLVVGLLLYNSAITAMLAYVRIALNMAGIALWPAIAIHLVLGVWCAIELMSNTRLNEARR